MKQQLTSSKLLIVLGIFTISLCILSFRQTDTTQQKTFRKEGTTAPADTTTPRKRNRSNTDIHLGDVDKAMKKLEEQMLKLDEQMLLVDKQMKKLDLQKIEIQVNEAVRTIDADKIAKDVEQAIAAVDIEEAQTEVKAALKEAKKVDKERIRLEMEEVKEQLSKQNLSVHLGEINEKVQKAMSEAKVSMEKAKEELKDIQTFTDRLHSDGLIDKDKPFKVEIKNGEMYINDKLQPKEVTDRYRQFFKKDDYTIQNGTKSAKGVAI